MTVKLFAEKTAVEVLCMPSPEREISGVYIGDLLSWVMGKAKSDDLWITIMSNVNVVAVATLADVSSIFLAEGVSLDDEIIKTAKEKGVNVLRTSLSAYDAALLASGALS
jgi:predicted transcriptional regulator